MVAQLYYTPTSCGAASFICAQKAGLLGTKVQANEANISTKKVVTGPNKDKDFCGINPKGNVPAIVTDDNAVLNENVATLAWIADQNPSAELAPPKNTNQYYEFLSKLSYLASEVHAVCGPLFNPQTPNEVKAFMKTKLMTKFDYISKNEFKRGKYLMGAKISAADVYFYVILSWMKYLNIDVSEYPVLKKFSEDVGSLDFVKAGHAAMAAASPPQ
uniref:GST C-terminal domain-containing protein n=1 Tax=Spongospora subterranea TaxID=70186 RepID=A0A0H5R6W3_9EUKA|eukprot:CRZ09492.1 hypothetical protein [Spongospora subterranea]